MLVLKLISLIQSGNSWKLRNRASTEFNRLARSSLKFSGAVWLRQADKKLEACLICYILMPK
jgi:hypothetical protein